MVGVITLYFTFNGSAFTLFTLNAWLLAAIGATALNLLMGTAGQVSMGNAAFQAVGAFVAVWCVRAQVPFPADIVVGAAAAGIVGVVVGIPALRIRGVYLALATLAAHFIVLYVADRYQAKEVGATGFLINPLYQDQGILGMQQSWAWTLFILLGLVLFVADSLMRSKVGRAWRLIRDHENVAPVMGIPTTRYKLFAFALSSTMIGLQGALALHLGGHVSTDDFTLLIAISYIAMILIGGLDSLVGPLLGAAIIVVLPVITPMVVNGLLGQGIALTAAPYLSEMVYGALIILFVVRSRNGIAGWARRPRAWLERQLQSSDGLANGVRP
jgi:branched-chain amino acid transport system permease protein